MSVFRRGLSQPFVDALRDEYEKDGWWRGMADHPDLFLAIRDDSLNLYYKGNSVLQLAYARDRLVGRTHYKYVLNPSEKAPYVHWVDGRMDREKSRPSLIENLDDPGAIVRASEPYVGEEKEGVHGIVQANPNVVDVEIALGSEHLCLDFAAFQRKADGGVELRFFEAKLFGNKDLRAQGHDAPAV